MKAIRYYRYGPPEVLELRDVDVPALGDNQVLIRVHAASVNALDWHFMRGSPYVMRVSSGVTRPKASGLGADCAGRVEAVGAAVTEFAAGDEVFGWPDTLGALAEYVTAAQDGALHAKPPGLTFAEAAAVPVAALTALQALRDHGHLRSGQRVLVNGAAGGVGTFTVQVAKALGAVVTAVCGANHVELIESLGADQVIDYSRDDFTATKQRYDLILDIAGSRPVSATRRLLVPRGTLIMVGGPNKGRWLGPLTRVLTMMALSPFSRKPMRFFVASPNRDDLAVIAGWLRDGTVAPVIDRLYPLADAAEAVRYVEQGHAAGKVVVTLDHDGT